MSRFIWHGMNRLHTLYSRCREKKMMSCVCCSWQAIKICVFYCLPIHSVCFTVDSYSFKNSIFRETHMWNRKHSIIFEFRCQIRYFFYVRGIYAYHGIGMFFFARFKGSAAVKLAVFFSWSFRFWNQYKYLLFCWLLWDHSQWICLWILFSHIFVFVRWTIP